MTIQWKMETIDHITTTKRRSIVERDVFVNKKGVHKIKVGYNHLLSVFCRYRQDKMFSSSKGCQVGVCASLSDQSVLQEQEDLVENLVNLDVCDCFTFKTS